MIQNVKMNIDFTGHKVTMKTVHDVNQKSEGVLYDRERENELRVSLKILMNQFNDSIHTH